MKRSRDGTTGPGPTTAQQGDPLCRLIENAGKLMFSVHQGRKVSREHRSCVPKREIGPVEKRRMSFYFGKR